MLMNLHKIVSALCLCAVMILLCGFQGEGQTSMKKESFGKTPDGQSVDVYTLINSNGAEARIINYGGIVVSLKMPDRKGKLADIVLGFEHLDGYIKAPSVYLGALIGRYANRIAGGRFKLNGVAYSLATNNGENHLHGGIKGFDKVIWRARPLPTKDGPALELNYLSKDKEESYPGNLAVSVVYTLTNRNELKVEYAAKTDEDTIINLTHHSYFNLAGEGNGDILNHQLMINADRFTPINNVQIPTGELRDVRGTPFDFTRLIAIGAHINDDHEQLKFGQGYDHNFVLNGTAGTLRQAAKVYEPSSGRVMEVWTTEPGLQLYSGNFLDGSMVGKDGKAYGRRYGFCLESQHFPDSPNQPGFPTTILKKGARYSTTTIYKFSTQ
jgi:aldose 1-epimerase